MQDDTGANSMCDSLESLAIFLAQFGDPRVFKQIIVKKKIMRYAWNFIVGFITLDFI